MVHETLILSLWELTDKQRVGSLIHSPKDCHVVLESVPSVSS